jgi:hypothetical protein
LKHFLRGQRVYLSHVLGLILPGLQIPSLPAHQIDAQSLDEWSEGDLQLMIEEGRRQADRQLSDLRDIRSRAQWLFTVGVPLVTVAATVNAAIDGDDSGWWRALWIVSLLMAGYGLFGAAAIMTIRSDFSFIDSATLSGYEPPVLRRLAEDYAGMLGLGENTIGTRLTVFRQAVVWLALGGYGALITWLSVR